MGHVYSVGDLVHFYNSEHCGMQVGRHSSGAMSESYKLVHGKRERRETETERKKDTQKERRPGRPDMVFLKYQSPLPMTTPHNLPNLFK